MHLCKHDSMN